MTKTIAAVFTLLFIGLLPFPGGAQVNNSSSDKVLLSDMLRIKQPGSIVLNKDGSVAYFTLTTIEAEDSANWEYQYNTQIWSVRTDGNSAPRQLTFSKAGASQPAISPDGQTLAFVRAVDGKPQIFLLPLKGGEAMQLTHSKHGAGGPVWSPDGSKIAFTASIGLSTLARDSSLNPDKKVPDWSLEKPGFKDNASVLAKPGKANPDGSIEEARAWLAKNEQDKKAKVINRLQFQGEAGTNGEPSFNQVFLIEAREGAKPVQVTRGYNRYSNVQFISNTKLLMDGALEATIHPDRNLQGAIYTINTDGSDLKMILGREGRSFSGSKLSENGKWIAFTHSALSFVSVPTLAIIPVNGSEKDTITVPVDRTKSELRWKGDDLLYATIASNGGSQLLQFDMRSKKIQMIGSQHEGIGATAIAGNRLVYRKIAVTNPADIYTADLQGKNEKRISSFNQDWVAQKKISIPEKFSFVNEKGQTVEYWVMKPVGFETGKKYPVLLQIHGGPSAMWGPGEGSMWHEFQYWCSKGYGVVYSNPRGSGGYGVDFLRGNINDWSKGPMSDVLTALDKALEQGWGDKDQLFVSGGSYAGYLVAYILAHDKRFKAGCSQRGVYDLRTFMGEGNAWRLVPNYFGGYPWQPEVLEILERESPINYVDKITTPYIIFHGENDLRTGVIQSEQLYKSLKILERPVEYVRHPGATHEITRSGNNRQRMDQLLRTWEFFERFR
jgi:dipeptidyl aminopeptidase/acylaminoacyl peptidase